MRRRRISLPSRPVGAPRLGTAENTGGERHASWLGVFPNLVFVVAIAELAHKTTEAA